MTIADLYNSVAQLGFEDSLESDDRFFYAVNRAVLQVNALRPAVRAYAIDHRPLENHVEGATFTPQEKTEELCFEAEDVKAYYFEADGNGTVYVELYQPSMGTWIKIGAVSLMASRVYVPYRGFIKQDGRFVTGRVRLRFVGEYIYAVKNVAMYAHLYSGDATDIPAFTPYVAYDISRLTEDFLSLASPPILDEGAYTRQNQGYDVENGRVILLPYGDRGLYRVLYHHRPQAAVDTGEGNNDPTPLDLDEELCGGLPTLVAAYYWADDEPEKAEYYMTLYREWAADIEGRTRNASPVTIRSTSGW